MNFHEAIKAARIKACFTQRQVAAEVGIDHTYLSKIESGAMSPSTDLTLRLATLYKIDAHSLLELGGKTLCKCSDEIKRLEDRIECLEAAILALGGRLYEKQV